MLCEGKKKYLEGILACWNSIHVKIEIGIRIGPTLNIHIEPLFFVLFYWEK